VGVAVESIKRSLKADTLKLLNIHVARLATKKILIEIPHNERCKNTSNSLHVSNEFNTLPRDNFPLHILSPDLPQETQNTRQNVSFHLRKFQAKMNFIVYSSSTCFSNPIFTLRAQERKRNELIISST
jgi:hypothetical protein